MTIFDWLASPSGVAMEHAVIVFLLAAAGYLNWRTRSVVKSVDTKLTNHINGTHVVPGAK
jgi:hypothetical protein